MVEKDNSLIYLIEVKAWAESRILDGGSVAIFISCVWCV